jgi:hypothetical protein
MWAFCGPVQSFPELGYKPDDCLSADATKSSTAMSEEPSILSTSSANGKRKRQRVSQACERCRAKKYRCDGAGPPCAACHAADTACIYGQAGQRRGLKTGYVKVLEILWGLVLKEVPNSEYVATQLLQTLSREDLDSNSPAALQSWRDSGLHSAIASLLDGEPSEYRTRDSTRGPPLASTWSLDISQDPPERTSADTLVDTLNSEHHVLPPISQTLLPRAEDPTALPALPPDWHLLLQAYLSYEGSWLPILPKSAIWRMAYAYEASAETSLDRDLHANGDVATLWAALMLGETHVNGAMSVKMAALYTRAHALLTPTSSSEPDDSYAPAFLLWSVFHMGCREFTWAKMKLVQAHVLATSHPPSTGESLLENACFLMDVLLALATNSKTLGIGSSSPAKEVCEGETTDWEPFIDPLKQQQNASNATPSMQSRPSRTHSTYHQFLELCTLLHTFSQGSDLRGNLEPTFDSWSASLPNHLRAGTPSSSSDPGPQLPSEANFQIFSLLLHSRIAGSGTHSPTHGALVTCDRGIGTETAKTLSSLQQHWDIRRLPLSFGVVIHLLSVDLTKHPADPYFEDTRASLRRFVADFAAHYAWRSLGDGDDTSASSYNNSTFNDSLLGDMSKQLPNSSAGLVFNMQEVANTSSNDGGDQQRSTAVQGTRMIHGNKTDTGGNPSAVFSEPDFGRPANGDLHDPMISDLDDSLYPGAYLDLFDSDERYVLAIRASCKMVLSAYTSTNSTQWQSRLHASAGLLRRYRWHWSCRLYLNWAIATASSLANRTINSGAHRPRSFSATESPSSAMCRCTCLLDCGTHNLPRRLQPSPDLKLNQPLLKQRIQPVRRRPPLLALSNPHQRRHPRLIRHVDTQPALTLPFNRRERRLIHRIRRNSPNDNIRRMPIHLLPLLNRRHHEVLREIFRYRLRARERAVADVDLLNATLVQSIHRCPRSASGTNHPPYSRLVHNTIIPGITCRDALQKPRPIGVVAAENPFPLRAFMHAQRVHGTHQARLVRHLIAELRNLQFERHCYAGACEIWGGDQGRAV